MNGRLVVVSNRVPTEQKPSGGLVVALHDALTKSGGLWIGSNGKPGTATGLKTLGDGDYTRMAFGLSEEEHEGYYLGYANSVLWPLCHRRADLIEIDHESAEVYEAVNDRVAGLLTDILRPDDLVWVQDYHFFPLAAALRKRGFRGRIGFFLHIPFPTEENLRFLPRRDAFLDWLCAYDSIGLQTRRDVEALAEVVGRADGLSFSEGRIEHESGATRVAAHPIGIDSESFAACAAEADGRAILGLGPDEPLIIGVDRLDYSKGLPNRFDAYGRFLSSRSENAPRPTFVQIAPPSRGDVKAYRDITRDLEERAGALNGQHADLDWTPLRYIHQSVPRERLAPIHRAARVGLVTPLADGMNLVAKEFVAAQDPRDPGVLILSHEAGAAEDLSDALLVNPYDTDEVARAIEAALSMELDERRRRWRALSEAVRATDVSGWAEACLDDLRDDATGRGDADVVSLSRYRDAGPEDANAVRSVILPVAGQGTRLLPATKVTPKELMPVYDTPVLQLAIDEAVAAGAERLVVVTHRDKPGIEEWFHDDPAAIASLKRRGKGDLAKTLSDTGAPGDVEVRFVYQDEQLGLGHAILMGREEVLDGPVGVILPDDVIMGTCCLRDMADAYQGGHMVAAMEVPEDRVSSYGIFVPKAEGESGPLRAASGMVEKPPFESAPSRLAAVGRYILDASIFDTLETIPRGAGGEYQITDAIAEGIAELGLTAFVFDGQRFDCGTHEGLLDASKARKGEMEAANGSEPPSAGTFAAE